MTDEYEDLDDHDQFGHSWHRADTVPYEGCYGNMLAHGGFPPEGAIAVNGTLSKDIHWASILDGRRPPQQRETTFRYHAEPTERDAKWAAYEASLPVREGWTAEAVTEYLNSKETHGASRPFGVMQLPPDPFASFTYTVCCGVEICDK